MRFGVLASAGGGVLAELHDALEAQGVRFIVVTDRECAAENVCKARGIPLRRIDARDNAVRSATAAQAFEEAQVDAVLLFSLKLVTSHLYAKLPTFNLHPSLLPAYAGFRAVSRARAAGARVLGATLHLVDSTVDEGPIVAQATMAADPAWPESTWNGLSFVQKVRLSFVLFELLRLGDLTTLPSAGTLHIKAGLESDDASAPALRDEGLRAWVDRLAAARLPNNL